MIDRRTFLTGIIGASAVGLIPLVTPSLGSMIFGFPEISELSFKVSPDKSTLSVSHDQGRTFQHALSLPRHTSIRDIQSSGSEYYVKVDQPNSANAFTLRSTDGQKWYTTA